MVMDLLAEGTDVRAGASGSRQQLHGAVRRLLGIVARIDAMPTSFLTDMLPQKLMSLRIEYANVKRVPLDVDELADPTGRYAVVSRLDFDTTVHVDNAFAVLVITKRFNRQRQQIRFFFREHSRHLSLRRTMDACIGPLGFPLVQVGLSLFQTFESLSFQGCLLRMGNSRFDFPFAIRISNPTWHGDHAVVRQHILEKRIQCGIVEIRREYAFLQVIENHDAATATEAAKSDLMQFG